MIVLHAHKDSYEIIFSYNSLDMIILFIIRILNWFLSFGSFLPIALLTVLKLSRFF